MNSWLRERNRRELDIQLGGREFQHLLHQAKRHEPVLAGFAEWTEILKLMQSEKSSIDSKVGVFSAILRFYQSGRDSRWKSILFAAYRLTLVSIHIRKFRWDDNPDDLWQNIVSTFYDAASERNTSDPRLLQTLYSETLKRLRNLYRRQWCYLRRHHFKPPMEMVEYVGGIPCPKLACVDCCDRLRFWRRRLKKWRRRGLISRQHAKLLFFTRVLGARVVDYCRRYGLNYELIRKQRQRVEAALRRHGFSMR